MNETVTIPKKDYEALLEAETDLQNNSGIDFILKEFTQGKTGIYMAKEDAEQVVVNTYQYELPAKGGALSYYKEHPIPEKGIFYGPYVRRMDDAKKNFTAFAYHFKGVLEHRVVGLIFLFLLRKQFESGFKALIASSHSHIRNIIPKRERYCEAVRELHDAFTLFSQDQIWLKARDLVCVILQYDNVYRYRFQDVMEEFDREAFNTNPVKEIQRLLSLLEDREVGKENMAIKWAKFRKLAWFLRFKQKELKRFFSLIDTEKMRMSEEDLYHANKGKRYKWGRKYQLK